MAQIKSKNKARVIKRRSKKPLSAMEKMGKALASPKVQKAVKKIMDAEKKKKAYKPVNPHTTPDPFNRANSKDHERHSRLFPLKKVRKKRPTKFAKAMGRVALAMGAVFVGMAVYKRFIENLDPVADEKTKNRIFDIITENCSSTGVNKMAIVSQANWLVREERNKRIKLERELNLLKEKHSIKKEKENA